MLCLCYVSCPALPCAVVGVWAWCPAVRCVGPVVSCICPICPICPICGLLRLALCHICPALRRGSLWGVCGSCGLPYVLIGLCHLCRLWGSCAACGGSGVCAVRWCAPWLWWMLCGCSVHPSAGCPVWLCRLRPAVGCSLVRLSSALRWALILSGRTVSGGQMVRRYAVPVRVDDARRCGVL